MNVLTFEGILNNFSMFNAFYSLEEWVFFQTLTLDQKYSLNVMNSINWKYIYRDDLLVSYIHPSCLYVGVHTLAAGSQHYLHVSW